MQCTFPGVFVSNILFCINSTKSNIRMTYCTLSLKQLCKNTLIVNRIKYRVCSSLRQIKIVLLENIRSDSCFSYAFGNFIFLKISAGVTKIIVSIKFESKSSWNKFRGVLHFNSDNSSIFHLQYHDSRTEQRFLANNDPSR